jgi:hypothetical protein
MRIPAWVRKRAWSRQLIIQLRKRVPVDIGGSLGVEPFVMAKSAACALTAASRRFAVGQGGEHEIDSMLSAMQSAEGSLGDGRWGYEFDVQTRWAYYPAGTPNAIAGVFCGRALGTAAVVMNRRDVRSGLLATCASLSDELLLAGETPWFRYVPGSDTLVHNANLLGAGILAAGGVLSPRREWVDVALAACRTSLLAQREDGGWPYGEGHHLAWEDSFHTAYNLDGLLLVWLGTGDEELATALERGVRHWSTRFFGDEGEPYYTPTKRFPYDVHSAATAIDVGSRLATWGFCGPSLPQKVFEWTRSNLVDDRSGVTYYQRRRLCLDRRHFVRWGDAHWELAQSAMALLESGRRDPLEEAVVAGRADPAVET